ncbi:MAG: hypothetical protein R3B07_37120, partial [Polyangiaceae bacterium]
RRAPIALPGALRCLGELQETCARRVRSYPTLLSKLEGPCVEEGWDPPAEELPEDAAGAGGEVKLWDSKPTCGPNMTAAALKAELLYRADKCSEAIPALEAVARGHYADNRFYRERAEYEVADCLYQTGDYEAATDLLAWIARDRKHAKSAEADYLLSIMVRDACPTQRVVLALASSKRLEALNEGHGLSLTIRIGRFAQARGFQLLGDDQRAAHAFAALKRDPDLGDAAAECFDIALERYKAKGGH